MSLNERVSYSHLPSHQYQTRILTHLTALHLSSVRNFPGESVITHSGGESNISGVRDGD